MEKVLIIAAIVAAVNGVAVVLYGLLEQVKDLTETKKDDKLFELLGKLLPYLQKLVGLIGAIRK